MGRMKTPEEAKKLHCCGGIGSHCMADKCMAWQWGSATRTSMSSEFGPRDSRTSNEGKRYCSLTSVKD